MKKILALMLCMVMAITCLSACGAEPAPDADVKAPEVTDPVSENNDDNADDDTYIPDATDEDAAVEYVGINIASMKGPTTMGMVKLMDNSESGASDICVLWYYPPCRTQIIGNILPKLSRV